MEENYFEYKDNFSKYKEIKSNLLHGSIEKILLPKVTIAIPTYKRPHLIKEAINSAINQVNYDDYEIIVVDNDDSPSENATEQLIKNYNNSKILYYKNEKNIGMFGNWNRCIELARGKYISILNDDDWLEKDFLYEISKKLKNKEAIHTGIKIFDYREKQKEKIILKNLKYLYKKLNKIKKIRTYTIIDFFFSNRGTGSLGIVFDTAALKSLGGYDEHYFPSSDYFYHTQYCQYFGAKLIKKDLCNYRIQENESINEETVKLWPMQGYNFRKYLIKNFLNKAKYCFLNEIITEKFIKDMSKMWRIKISYDKNKASIKNTLYLSVREIIKNIF